jgi:hypothetical protein
MKRIFPLSIFTLILLLSCEKKSEESVCSDIPLETSTFEDSTDYKIINSLIEYFYPTSDFIHVDQKTLSTTSDESDFIIQKLTNENIEIDSMLILNYIEKNKLSNYLSQSLIFNPVKLINSEELTCFINIPETGWEKY